MTAQDFIKLHPDMPLVQLLSAAEFKLQGGELTKLRRHELDSILREGGCPVPDNREHAEILARHVVNIEHDRMHGATDEQLQDRQTKLRKAIQFWCDRAPQREFTDAVTEAAGVVKPKRQGGGAKACFQQAATQPADSPFLGEGKKLKGQQLAIFTWFQDHPGKAVGQGELGHYLEKQKVPATQPHERVAAFYLNDWRKKGWLELA